MIPLYDTVVRRKTPIITWLIILSNIGVLLYQNSLSGMALNRFILEFGFIPGELIQFIAGQTGPEVVDSLRPLVTSQFLHGGWLHLAGNMWILWLFGDNIEDRIGHLPFSFFYIASGVAAGITHFAVDPVSPVPAIGASGAVAGVMGAYLFLFPRARVVALVPLLWIPFFFRIPAFIYIGFWFFSQIMMGISDLFVPGQAGGVAWWAHVGGFIFGFLAVWLFRFSREPKAACDEGPFCYRGRRPPSGRAGNQSR